MTTKVSRPAGHVADSTQRPSNLRQLQPVPKFCPSPPQGERVPAGRERGHPRRFTILVPATSPPGSPRTAGPALHSFRPSDSEPPEQLPLEPPAAQHSTGGSLSLDPSHPVAQHCHSLLMAQEDAPVARRRRSRRDVIAARRTTVINARLEGSGTVAPATVPCRRKFTSTALGSSEFGVA